MFKFSALKSLLLHLIIIDIDLVTVWLKFFYVSYNYKVKDLDSIR